MSNARRASIRNTRRQSSDHDDEDTIEFQSGSEEVMEEELERNQTRREKRWLGGEKR